MMKGEESLHNNLFPWGNFVTATRGKRSSLLLRNKLWRTKKNETLSFQLQGSGGTGSFARVVSSTSRYDPEESKYTNKRIIEYQDIPNFDVDIRKASDQNKSYGWWPVAILKFKESVYRENKFPDTANRVYCICIYQALRDTLYAWGMKTSKNESGSLEGSEEGPLKQIVARNTFLPCPMSILLSSASLLVPPPFPSSPQLFVLREDS